MKNRFSSKSIKNTFIWHRKLNCKLFKIIVNIFLFYSYFNSSSYNFFGIFKMINKNMDKITSFELSVDKNLSKKVYDDFLFINKKKLLLEKNIKRERRINPDITVIMTVYNQGYCLHKCLRSIQNQSMNNIEIIIVDDCSLDNSSQIIKEYQNEDKRIIFIEHDANEGVIKSRSDAIRNSRGQYITVIDGDDAFIHKDILKNSLYIAKKANLDIVEFQAAVYKNDTFQKISKNYPLLNLNKIIYQPELRTKFIFINRKFPYDFINRAIWGKLIKKNIFKKMLKEVGEEYTQDFINFAEDTIMVISILHLANSYYLMKEVGYLYSQDKKKEFVKLKNKKCREIDKIKNFDYFKFLKFLVEKCKEDEKEQIMAYREITSINYNTYFNKKKLEKKHYDIIYYIFKKALQFKFLLKEHRDNLIYLKNIMIEKQNKEKGLFI